MEVRRCRLMSYGRVCVCAQASDLHRWQMKSILFRMKMCWKYMSMTAEQYTATR